MTVRLASYKGIGILLLHLFHSDLQITTTLDNRSIIGVLLGGLGYSSNLYKRHFHLHLLGGMFDDIPRTKRLTPSWDLCSVLLSGQSLPRTQRDPVPSFADSQNSLSASGLYGPS